MNTPDPKRWTALFLLCAAQFLVILDASIIGVALPAIQKALGITAENLQWIFNAYVVTFGGLLLLGGRLADLFGQRRVFAAGWIVLTLASLLAGLAPDELTLDLARALQGVGAALISPAAMSLMMGLFHDPRELGRAFGFWGASAAAGGSAGVFLGGVITQWLDWRWTFLIYVPLGLGVLALTPTLLRKGTRASGTVDWLGALTVTGAITLAVLGLVRAETLGWTSAATLGTLGGAATLLIVFLALQATLRAPLMPLQIFRAPNLSVGNLVNALLAGSWIPLWFFLNLYLQQVLGYNALQGGLALLPMTLLIMILMVNMTGRVIAAFGIKKNLVIGLTLLVVSLALLGRAPADGNFLVDVLPATLIAAFGMAFAYIPATMASVSGARPEDSGLASGIVNTTYQVGSAVGLAAIVAVANANGNNVDASAAQLNTAYHAAFLSAAAIAAGGVLLTLLGVRVPDFKASATD
ncbi:MFS transporter [Deinococcus pimensis]|uniref:MFS transporter n=1 Tax=Deinococcus pimensis TaxID=309888 RepID=UPI0004877CF7|nr:MFS transporter [Deinococcus pimensis]